MITGLAHVALVASDMQKSLDFYCGALGLTHAFSIPREDGTPWIEYLKICPGQFLERDVPRQGRDKNWQCWVDDPDGHRIELMQIDPASPQALA